MAITKDMLARCQNELKQAFCALPEDVQKAIRENFKHAQCLQSATGGNKWAFYGSPILNHQDAYTWRLSPDTPTEPEWEERDVTEKNGSRFVISTRGTSYHITVVLGDVDFIGIIYLKDGVETLRTSVDAAFGTPVRVRFSK